MNRLSLQQVSNKFKKRGFILLSKKWLGAEHNYEFRCNTCKKKFARRYYNMHTNSTCPYCRVKKQYNKLNIVYWTKFGNKVNLNLLTNVYKSSRIPMQWECQICKFKFKNAACNIKAGSNCPKCAGKISRNEELIRKYFEVKTGRLFPNVRPDFLINPYTSCRLELDGYNDELKIAFEYDGEQHFHSIVCWGGKNRLIKTQYVDVLKNKLCKRYGVSLLRINYREINHYRLLIDNFLEDNL